MSWVAVGLGAASIAGSVGGAYLSKPDTPGLSKDQKRAIAANSAQQFKAAEQARLANELAGDQLLRSEQAKIGLWGNLGEPGTYEDSFEDYRRDRPISGTRGGSGLFKKETRSSKIERGDIPHGWTLKEDPVASASAHLLKPGAYQNQMQDTRQYRLASYMTAEADQLVRQEGPLWNKLKQSVVGPIMEGSATANREIAEALSREAARGGSARNRAVQTAQKIASMEDVARDRMQNLWQASLSLIQYGRDRATQQLAFNQAWVNNLPGTRDAFNAMFTGIQQFYGNTVSPQQVAAAQGAIDNTYNALAIQQQSENNKQVLGSMIAGVGQIIGGAFLEKGINNLNVNQKTWGGSQTEMLSPGFNPSTGGGYRGSVGAPISGTGGYGRIA